MQLEVLGANLLVLIIAVIIGIIIVFLWKDKRLVKMAIRNLGRRKVRNILTVVGVALSISLFVAFNIASENAIQSFYNIIELSGGKVDFEITRIDGQPFDERVIDDVLKVEGVIAAAPRIQRYCVIQVHSNWNSTSAQVIGIDPEYDNEFGDLFDYNTSESINDLVIGKNAIVSELLMKGISGEVNGKIVNATAGDEMTIKYRSGSTVKNRHWEIAAFAEVTGKAREVGFGRTVFITLHSAQRFFPKCNGKADIIIVEMDPAYKDKWQDVQQRIQEVIGSDLEVFSPKQTQLESARSALEGMRSGILFAAMTSVVAMVFLTFNAINMTITERTYEIGVLRSIGFKKRHIFRLFFYEVLVFGITGSGIGVLSGIGLSRVLFLYLTHTIFSSAATSSGVSFEFLPINTTYLLEGFILGVIFTIIGGFYPLLSITGMKIINEMRPEARTSEKPSLGRRMKWVTGGIGLLVSGIGLIIILSRFSGIEISTGMYLGPILVGMFMFMVATGIILIAGGLKRKYLVISAGIVLLATGLIDTLYIGSFISSYVLMGGSIVFTASILRGVGGFFDFFIRRIPGLRYVSSLASKNIARKPTRSTLTFGIFTVVLAMVITIAAIMNSIGIGIIRWVDTNIEADMFITSNVGAPPNLSGNITRHIEGIHWANTSEGMVPACTIQEMSGARFFLWNDHYDSLLMGINSTNYAVVNPNTPIIEPNGTDTFTLFERLKNPNENACIISDKLANELKAKIGQKTPISIWSHGNYTKFKIIGIMRNDVFGYPKAGYFCIIDINKFYDFGFDKEAHFFTIKLDKRYPNGTEVNPQIVVNQINERWGDEYKLTFSLKENIEKDVNRQVQQIGTFFSIISYSSIIVGLLAVVTTMTKIVSERRREIGLLRTIGIKRIKVVQLILFESIFLALIGLILGIIDGYIMGSSIVHFIGSAGGIPFTVEFVMPWIAIVQTTIVAVVVAIIGALFPAWQAGLIAPAESLRYTG